LEGWAELTNSGRVYAGNLHHAAIVRLII